MWRNMRILSMFDTYLVHRGVCWKFPPFLFLQALHWKKVKHKVTLNVEEKNQSLLCRVKNWVVDTSIFGELNVTITYTILDNKVSEKVYLHTSTNKDLITVSFCPNIGTLGTSLPHNSWDCRASAVAVKFTFPEE